VIPTGVEIGELGAGVGARFRAAHGIPSARPMALHVGRVAHEKNLHFLLEAADLVRRRIPDLLLVVTGEGPALPDLRRRVAELDLARHVRFLGYLDRRHGLADAYAAADCLAFASQTETQGLVLLEAMALEVPVISTAILGTRDVVGPGRGAVVVEDDVAAFAAQTLVLLEDPARRRRLGCEGRRYVEEEWSDRATMSRTLDLYADLLSRGRAAAAAGRGACPLLPGSA
jgi:glycosyltransferase involved in cell wall biosynthesis